MPNADRVGLANRDHESESPLRDVPQGAPIGLIAGWGRFPICVAEKLKALGHSVHCVAITGHAGEELNEICDSVLWSGVGRFGGHLRYFKRNDVEHVTMAGKLFKSDLLYSGSVWIRHTPDWTCIKTFWPCLFGARRDARDDRLLGAVIDTYESHTMKICSATELAPELLAKTGQLTRRKPSSVVQSDIAAGWQIAKTMGGLDIGQAITIKDGTIIAVEAIEGTDACIARTGELCRRGGWTLVKVSKPEQDMRFDVPTIGPQTVQRVHEAGGAAIAIEANKTILLDSDETIALADRLGIALVAMASADTMKDQLPSSRKAA
ncbi:hypothetical protein CEE69_16530 [Rhodopirellula bahusiensis]|uniref:DUF1009 domain-containing protein n=1 Tax=Rhodopirellula bahusiensis TaxID=2014065 RepID=A0A2G1W5K3_9BACT|nr:hypothetical protein CEE69_16530 [Rhodopirellula bahusiensis]